jgi:transposase
LTPGSGAVTLGVMSDNDGRKLDHQTLEAIRLRAVEQVNAGVPAAEVGRGLAALGLHPKTIYTWLAKQRTEGPEALRARPVPGPRRKLTDAQLGELADLIEKADPRDHGFAVALWTREVVRQLIAAQFGVPLTVASVGRTLHDLGLSAQRPLYRAEQADSAAVAARKPGRPAARCTSPTRPGCAATTTPAPPGPRSARPQP